ncbi:uncharacterized protein LOC128884047 [Hylaeus volcanicus]|uniref:uncharacterized protein LOC128884047 n=1 Tax=Hylaeus volcanicus TaxID=313075 RepID=UPI0023B85DFB|nr:uncharacterized protein LOC128884047 [Hylaeus volcanicus]
MASYAALDIVEALGNPSNESVGDPYLGYLCPALGVMNGLSFPIVGNSVNFNETISKSTDEEENYLLPEISVYGYITSSRLKIFALIEENEYPVSPTNLKQFFVKVHTIYADTISNPFFLDTLDDPCFFKKLDTCVASYTNSNVTF